MSSIVIILSFGLMNIDSALSRVVLPELVPPETIMFAGFTPSPSTQSHKNDAISLFNVLYLIKSTMVKGSFLNLRMVIVGPFAERDPGGIRTHDPQLRRLLLYPAELPDRSLCRFRSVGQISKVGAKVMNFLGFASGFASYDTGYLNYMMIACAWRW